MECHWFERNKSILLYAYNQTGGRIQTSGLTQWKLDPTMKEIVKKEVIKLLEACMVYPISNSSWVSMDHVVPKKGGINDSH